MEERKLKLTANLRQFAVQSNTPLEATLATFVHLGVGVGVGVGVGGNPETEKPLLCTRAEGRGKSET